jgi:hypothetical protein
MIRGRAKIVSSLALVALLILAGGTASANATPVPIKLIPNARFGREVNITQVKAKSGPVLEDVCSEPAKECQEATESSVAGGYSNPESVAGAPNGNVYVVDNDNHRIQELEPNGKFVLMFGKEVNETNKSDICTAASGDTCGAGVESTVAGQIDDSFSVTVDPLSGDVYVFEDVGVGYRVQKFSPGGEFLLEIGREVNKTTKGNLCTNTEAAKGVECGAPTATGGSSEHGAFDPGTFLIGGNVLSTGGSEDLLYVADEHRLQEFDSEGEWKGEVPTDGTVTAVASAGTTGDVALVEDEGEIVRDLDSTGKLLHEIALSPQEAGGEIFIRGLAFDTEGQLAVSAVEKRSVSASAPFRLFGGLYEASNGRQISAFAFPVDARYAKGIGFDDHGELFVPANSREVFVYTSVNIAELQVRPQTCMSGVEHETDETAACTINGVVNPYGVAKTEIRFKWGNSCSALEIETPLVLVPPVTAEESVSALVEGLKPNAPLCYDLAGYDQNVEPPEEPFTSSETESVTTPLAPVRIVGGPTASFLTASSAVLSSEVNPENAGTEYVFEYAPGTTTLAESCPAGVRFENCTGVASSTVARSSVYGQVGVTVGTSDLQPGTSYHYRLFAEAENTEKTEKIRAIGPEGVFTTTPSPAVEATTSSASAVTSTSAVVSGTVDPDGRPATYVFELGVYAGTGTQYGIVYSGLAGESAVPVAESLTLTGLQPGVTYAYRITVRSGYGEATGTPATFTTEGLPIVLPLPAPLAHLPVPVIAFPPTSGKSKTKAKKRTGKKAKKTVTKSRKAKKGAAKKSNSRKRKGS